MTINSISQAKKLIFLHFPNFLLQKIIYLGEGLNNCVYEVNDQYIFQFPKHFRAEKDCEKEIYLLNALRPNLNILVPNFQFIANEQKSNKSYKKFLAYILRQLESILNKYHLLIDFDKSRIICNCYDKIFVGYKKISGTNYSDGNFNTLSALRHDNIAQQLANFFLCLHNLKVENLEQLNINTWHFDQQYYAKFEPIINEYIIPKISPKQAEILLKYYYDYLSQPAQYEYIPYLIHADITCDHIIFDKSENQIAGIIDFGEVCIGDPDYDFFIIYQEYGRELLELILMYYGRSLTSQVWRKFQFLDCCFASLSVKQGKQNNIPSEEIKGWNRLTQVLIDLEKRGELC
jgi:aminoglycoside 2''-phosphotransferase